MSVSEKSGRIKGPKRNFSIVSNVILRDKNISLRAKGLYSVIQAALSQEQFGRITYKSDLMKNWCSDGRDAFNTAWKELISKGYLKIEKKQNEKGHFIYEYELMDEPENDNDVLSSNPDTDFPYLDKPKVDEPHLDNPSLYKYKNKIIFQKNNINQSNQSDEADDKIDRTFIDFIKNQIDYPKLISDNPYDKDRINEIVMLIDDIYSSKAKTIHCNSEDRPADIVKSRYLKLDNSCIQYVLDSFRKQSDEIRNIRNYLITSLYNAPVTVSHNYLSQYNHLRGA